MFCVKSLQVLCIISTLFPTWNDLFSTGEDIKNSSKKKKYKAAVARGIDETCNAVQLNGFFGKTLYFYNLFSQCNFTCVFICFSICQSTFLSYYFLALSIIQYFSLNFVRTLGRAVDKLLNSSRVNSHWQFIFGKQSLSLFWIWLSNKTESVTLTFSGHGKTWSVLYFFFVLKSELLTIKIAS